MNAQIANPQTLSFALQTQAFAAAHPARRRFVDRSPLQPAGLERFNKLLTKLCHTPLDSETPTSVPFNPAEPAGHQPQNSGQHSDCLATVVSRMIADPGWQIDEQAIVPARLVIEQMRKGNDPTAGGGSTTGQFYFAAVIDAAWPKLIEEVDCYLDFCRIRVIEAGMRGCGIEQLVFGRVEWWRARRAEAALVARGRRLGSFQSTVSTSGFRVC